MASDRATFTKSMATSASQKAPASLKTTTLAIRTMSRPKRTAHRQLAPLLEATVCRPCDEDRQQQRRSRDEAEPHHEGKAEEAREADIAQEVRLGKAVIAFAPSTPGGRDRQDQQQQRPAADQPRAREPGPHHYTRGTLRLSAF